MSRPVATAAGGAGLAPARVRGGPGPRTRGGALLALGIWSLAGVGCAALAPAPLEVPPGHRVVLGRIDLSQFGAQEALLEIDREGGGFRLDLPVGLGQRDLAITLPPGRYRILRVRLVNDRQTSPTHPLLEAGIAFEVGPEPAVYVGTLRLFSDLAARRVAFTVADEYDETVPRLRARHPGIGEPIARSLFHPA